MTLVPASIKAPAQPQVNLMPPEVATRRARGRRRGAIGFILLMFVALLAGAVYFVDTQKTAALDTLAEAEAEGDRLRAEIAQYSEVPRLRGEIQQVESARRYAGATEILWVPFLSELRNAIPEGVSVTSVGISTVGPLASPESDAGLLTRPDIGVLSLSGEALSYSALSVLEESLEAVPMFERVRISGASVQETSGAPLYEYSAVVRVNARALSSRFTEAWSLFDSYEVGVAKTIAYLRALDPSNGEDENGEGAAAIPTLEAPAASSAAVRAAEQRNFIAVQTLAAWNEVNRAQYALVDALLLQTQLAGFPQSEIDRLSLSYANAIFDLRVAQEAFAVYWAWQQAEDEVERATGDLDYANLRLLHARAELSSEISGAQERIDRATADAADAQARLEAGIAARGEAEGQLSEPYSRLEALVAYREAQARVTAAESILRDAIVRAESGTDEDRAAREAAEEDLRSAQDSLDRAKAALDAAGVVIELDAPDTLLPEQSPTPGGASPSPSPSGEGGQS